MDNQNTTENKTEFLQNDKLLVCSMFVFYGLCIIGLIAGAFVWLGQRNATMSANATSTAQAIAAEKANATATAMIRITEQAQFKQIERFDNNDRYWLTGPLDDEYFTGNITIVGGIYKWDIREVKQTFVYWARHPIGGVIEDFDMYVDTKIANSVPGGACSGIIFRMASLDWEEGAYIFSVCDDSSFYVYYYENGEWDVITESSWIYSDTIQRQEWNRLEVSARGDQTTFTINNRIVYEMKDDRQLRGGLGVFIEIKETNPASIWFDNLGFRVR